MIFANKLFICLIRNKDALNWFICWFICFDCDANKTRFDGEYGKVQLAISHPKNVSIIYAPKINSDGWESRFNQNVESKRWMCSVQGGFSLFTVFEVYHTEVIIACNHEWIWLHILENLFWTWANSRIFLNNRRSSEKSLQTQIDAITFPYWLHLHFRRKTVLFSKTQDEYREKLKVVYLEIILYQNSKKRFIIDNYYAWMLMFA